MLGDEAVEGVLEVSEGQAIVDMCNWKDYHNCMRGQPKLTI